MSNSGNTNRALASTASVWQDNSGHYYLVKGQSAWTTEWHLDDELETFRAAAADWNAGEWEPSEGDGWVSVDDWQRRLDAEQDAAAGDRTRQIGPTTMSTITYTLTDTVGTSGSLTVDADVTTAQLEAWFLPGEPADDPGWSIVRLNIDRLAKSFGARKPSWDEAAAEYLGITVTTT